MKADTIVAVLLFLLLIAGALLGIRCYNSYQTGLKLEAERLEAERLEKWANDVGDVDLRESLLLRDFRTLLKAEPEIKRTGGNQVTAAFGSGVVELTFYHTGEDLSIIENYPPVGILVRVPFKGSLCGAYLTDTVEQAREHVIEKEKMSRSLCIPRQIKPGDSSEEWTIEMVGDYSLSRIGRGGALLSLWNKNYTRTYNYTFPR